MWNPVRFVVPVFQLLQYIMYLLNLEVCVTLCFRSLKVLSVASQYRQCSEGSAIKSLNPMYRY